MIPRKGFQVVIVLAVRTLFLLGLPLTSSLNPLIPYPINGGEHQSDISGTKVSIPKFGEVPTNRVLPVDHLTKADYEDIQESDRITDNDVEEGVQNREYCARLFRSDFIKTIKSKRRKSRQEEDEELDQQQANLLANYLDFDPTKVVGQLFTLMGSAAARNSTAIDENYKKLPPFVKNEVTDIIEVFKGFLESIQP